MPGVVEQTQRRYRASRPGLLPARSAAHSRLSAIVRGKRTLRGRDRDVGRDGVDPVEGIEPGARSNRFGGREVW